MATHRTVDAHCPPAPDPAAYPTQVSVAFIMDLVTELHGHDDDRAADLEEGDLLARIGRFPRYTLRPLLLTTVDLSEFTVHEPRAQDYAARPTALPPVVYDPTACSMIDGLHRAVAASLRGDTHLWAYVGQS